MINGQIVKNISNKYTVLCANEKEIVCLPRGKFRQEKVSPFVGDEVIVNETTKTIEEINPRKNFLERPSVANIDYALIVTSLKEPTISLNLLDKQISSITIHNIKPVICFTKLDLLTKEEENNFLKIKNYYHNIGIPVFTNNKLEELLTFLENKLVVLTGQSGAGKSTLLNKIDPKLNLKTDQISYSLNRGKHTTRHTEIFKINNIWFCDTPGFSSLDLSKYSLIEIKNSFIEFRASDCEFKDCKHLKEKNCAVKNQVLNNLILPSRYYNYLEFIKESGVK